MKKLIPIVLFLCLAAFANAQEKGQQQVNAAVEKMRLALISGDRASLESIAASKLSYGHSSGKIQDKVAFVEAIANGSSDFVSIEYRNQTCEVSGKTALVRHELHAKTNDGGKPGEAHLGVLLVWQKQGKDWLLLARQAFKLSN